MKTEQCIQNLFPVDIQYNLKIDCEVTLDRFKHLMLRYMHSNKIPLLINKSLKFSIKECNVNGEFDIYWKVRNEGPEALSLEQIRGQIIKTNKFEHEEITSFRGSHYVECYIVKNGVCVARDRIAVPIT